MRSKVISGGPMYNLLLIKNIKSLNQTYDYKNNIYQMLDNITENIGKGVINTFLYNIDNIITLLKITQHVGYNKHYDLYKYLNTFLVNRFYLFSVEEIDYFNNYYYNLKREFKTFDVLPVDYNLSTFNYKEIGYLYFKDLNLIDTDISNNNFNDAFSEKLKINNLDNKYYFELVNNHIKINIHNKTINILYYEDEEDINNIIRNYNNKKFESDIFIISDLIINNQDIIKEKDNFYDFINEVNLENKKNNIIYNNVINNEESYDNLIKKLKENNDLNQAKRFVYDKKTNNISLDKSVIYLLSNHIHKIQSKKQNIILINSDYEKALFDYCNAVDIEEIKSLFKFNLELEKNIFFNYSMQFNKFGCSACEGNDLNIINKNNLFNFTKYNLFNRLLIGQCVDKILNYDSKFDNNLVIINKNILEIFLNSLFNNPNNTKYDNNTNDPNYYNKLIYTNNIFNKYHKIKGDVNFINQSNDLKHKINTIIDTTDLNRIFNINLNEFINKKKKCDAINILKSIRYYD